jgi:hypothetical protein
MSRRRQKLIVPTKCSSRQIIGSSTEKLKDPFAKTFDALSAGREVGAPGKLGGFTPLPLHAGNCKVTLPQN